MQRISVKKVSDNIKHYGIIKQDHKLAKNYQEAKVIIDDYHRALDGDLKQGKKIQGLNEKANLYRQILSDYDPLIFETIENDEELITELNDSPLQLIDRIPTQLEGEIISLTTALSSLKEALENADIDTLWLRNNRAITDLFHTLFGDFGLIHTALEHCLLNFFIAGLKKEYLLLTTLTEKREALKRIIFLLNNNVGNSHVVYRVRRKYCLCISIKKT